MGENSVTEGRQEARLSRRGFLTLVGLGGAGVGVGALPGCSSASPPSAGSAAALPRQRLARLADLKVGQAQKANYPDGDSPVVVLKLGNAVPDGVGPDRDVVAYSSQCTHRGCPLSYRKDPGVLGCGCHFSSFDPARSGMLIMGPATTNLPQVVLEVDNGDLFAVGVRGLIWGRESNLV